MSVRTRGLSLGTSCAAIARRAASDASCSDVRGRVSRDAEEYPVPWGKLTYDTRLGGSCTKQTKSTALSIGGARMED
jgi:hypothetical protein